MPKITLSHSDGSENKYGLEGKLFTVGRAKDNDLVLPDGSSSNYHAVMKTSESGDFSLTDLGSTNHTRVNGKRITTRELRDGDRILFGDTLAVYESDITHDSPTPADPSSTSSLPRATDGEDAPQKNAVQGSKKKASAPPAPASKEDNPPQSGGCLGLVIFLLLVGSAVLASVAPALAAP